MSIDGRNMMTLVFEKLVHVSSKLFIVEVVFFLLKELIKIH
ncbi:hypothetical protein SDC9_186058 [bioreactor metagenome]|uniref:Uncharacterized protein n=1 Tax=bioreactor metagenome TaxID=1076179 RepID=A0A645HQX2_9ZZZZ